MINRLKKIDHERELGKRRMTITKEGQMCPLPGKKDECGNERSRKGVRYLKKVISLMKRYKDSLSSGIIAGVELFVRLKKSM